MSPVFREALYNSWRGWARLLLHCLISIAVNSSGPPEEFCEIVFIASMSSLAILMSDSGFACGCPKKSFGYLIIIVGSGVLKTLLYCSFSSSLIFCCLVQGSPLHPGEVQFQLWSLSCFLWICWSTYFGFFLIAAIALVSLRFLSVFIEILKLFSISLIWFSTFSLVWWFVDLCIFVCNFDLFLIKALLSLGIWCFLGRFVCRTGFLQISRQILLIILYISPVLTSVNSDTSQLVLSRSASILAQLMSSLKKFKSL